MADMGNREMSSRRQSSRLQRKAPASMQISPVKEWKAAIPLLSPLVQSPISNDNDVMDETKSCCVNGKKEAAATTVAEKPVVVAKLWQHPAQPFGYEAAPILPFVCTGNLDR